MECLKNLVGISESDCQCVLDGLTDAQKAELRLSQSGLYLDKHLDGGVSLADVRLLDACEAYFGMAKNALEVAGKRFSDDLLVALSMRYKSTKPRFLGSLGQVTYAGNLNVSKKYQLLKIEAVAAGFKSTVLTINGIRLITTSDGMVNVRIIAVRKGERDGIEKLSTTITTQANRYGAVNITEPITLPMYVDGFEIEYFIAWERPEGLSILPKDNKNSCNCTGGNGFESYVRIYGGETDSLEDLSASDGYSHGFSIDVEIKCETGNVVCREFDASNEVAVISAWAVLYKAGELLNEYILASTEITRFTTMSREHLYGKRNHFRKEYETRVSFLASEIDLTSSDCYICRENRMFVGNVFG